MRRPKNIIIGIVAFLLALSGLFAQQIWQTKNSVNPPPQDLFINRELNQWTEPEDKSKLITSSTSEIASYKKNICTDPNTYFDCYQKYYKNLTKDVSVAAAFADLKKRYNDETYIRAQCHPLSHIIGRTAAQKYASPSAAYTEGDSFCWSGYYHGVLEGIIAKIGITNLPKKMDTICADIPGKDRYSFDYYNCVHGLGHGVMSLTHDELFKSLEYCDLLTGRGNWEQVSCASGAFMENIIEDGLNHKTKYLKPEDPLYPCNASPEKYRNTCYLMQTSYVLKTNGYNFSKTFDVCSNAEEKYRNTCYQSLGRDASGQSTSNVAQTKATCLLGKDTEQQSQCIIGAVKDFISYLHNADRAHELCNSFENTELKNTCIKTADEYVKVL